MINWLLGFHSLCWRDVSETPFAGFRQLRKSGPLPVRAPKNRKKEKPRPGISLLLGPDAVEKSRNVFRNLSENRIRTVFGVFQKSG
ncbi:MAG: hypothetical protein R2874_08605 [Desulfobacterales bacterium]